MTEHITPRPAILPFLIGDLLLLAAAGGIVYQSPWPLSVGHMALCTAAVALGAWLMVTPFILQHRAELKLAEADALSSTVAQIQNLEQIKTQIAEATANWSNIQGECTRTVATAKEVAEGMATEAKAFTEFLQKANDSEKATLRLEVDKLRRMEGDWLQVLVRILDHVYAINVAAAQSGQPNLIQQLGHFQNACRDAARRIGLVPFVPEPGEPFDPQVHQPTDTNATVPANACVAQTLITGINYQGRVIRPALVALATDTSHTTPVAETAPTPEPTAEVNPALVEEPPPVAPEVVSASSTQQPDPGPTQAQLPI